MGVSQLIETPEAKNQKLVAVKLTAEIVGQIQMIRKETGKTNSEVYGALLSEGITAYNVVKGRNGRRRGRPPKATVTRARASEVGVGIGGTKKKRTKKKAKKRTTKARA